MVRRFEVVRPVQKRRDPGVKRLRHAQQITHVRIMRTKQLAETEMDAGQVLAQCPVGTDIADRRLPRVAVRVDESWQDYHVRRVDDFGFHHIQARGDRGDLPVFDQDVTLVEPTVFGIHGEHGSTGNQGALNTHRQFLLIEYLESGDLTQGRTVRPLCQQRHPTPGNICRKSLP